MQFLECRRPGRSGLGVLCVRMAAVAPLGTRANPITGVNLCNLDTARSSQSRDIETHGVNAKQSQLTNNEQSAYNIARDIHPVPRGERRRL